MSIKYEKIGLRRDRNLSDLADKSAGLTNLLNNLALPGETFVGADLFVINNISDTDVTSSDFLNFVNLAIDSTQIRYQIRIKAETPSQNVLFEQGTRFIYNDIEFQVIVYTTPAAAGETGNINGNYELEIVLQTPSSEEIITVGATLDIANQPFIVQDILIDREKTQNVFTVAPLITLRDQIEFFRLNTGFDPKFSIGGDGPDAKFYPWVEVNPFADLTFSGAPDYANDGPSYITGQDLVEHAGNTFTPVSYGPFKFWDHGSFIFGSKIFDTVRFNDGAGLVQWQGYVALNSWSSGNENLTVTTNADFLWEQYREDIGQWVIAGANINGYSTKVIWDRVEKSYIVTHVGFDSLGNAIRPGFVGLAEGKDIVDAFGPNGFPVTIDSYTYQPEFNTATFKILYTPQEEEDIQNETLNPNFLNAPVLTSLNQIYSGDGLRISFKADTTRSEFLSYTVELLPFKQSNEKVLCRLTAWYPKLAGDLTYSNKIFNVKNSGNEGVKFTRWFSTYDANNEATNIESLNFYDKNAVDSYNEIIDSSLTVNNLTNIFDEPQLDKKHWNDLKAHYEYHTSTVLPSTNVLDRTSVYPMVLNTSLKRGLFGHAYYDNSGQTIKRGDIIISWQDVKRGVQYSSIAIDESTVQHAYTRPWGADALANMTPPTLNFDIFVNKVKAVAGNYVFLSQEAIEARNQVVPSEFTYPPKSFEGFVWADDFPGRASYYDKEGLLTDEARYVEAKYLGVPVTQSMIIANEGVVDVWFEQNNTTKSMIAESYDTSIQIGPEYVSTNNLVFSMYIPSDDFYSDYWAEVIQTVDTSDNSAYEEATGTFTITNHGFDNNEIVQISDMGTNALGTNSTQNFKLILKLNDNQFKLANEINDLYNTGAYELFTQTTFTPTIFTPVASTGGNIGIYSYGWKENPEGYQGKYYSRTLGDRSSPVFENTSVHKLSYTQTSANIQSITSTGNPTDQEFFEWNVTFSSSITPGTFNQADNQGFSVPVMFSATTDTAFEKKIMTLEWVPETPATDVDPAVPARWKIASLSGSTQYELSTAVTEAVFFETITGGESIDDAGRILEYSAVGKPWWDTRMSTAESYTNKTQRLSAFSYNENTNEVTYSVDNFQNIQSKLLVKRIGRNGTGVDIDPEPKYIHIIQSDKSLQDYSKLSFCAGVLGKTLTNDVPVGSTTIPIENTAGLQNGMIVQFDGYIPLATVISNVGINQITISAPVSKALKAGYIVTISNDNLRNYELCNASLNTAPPFEGTEQGLKTVTGFEDLQVNELVFNQLQINNAPSSNISPEVDGFDYDSALKFDYLNESTGTRKSFRLLIK